MHMFKTRKESTVYPIVEIEAVRRAALHLHKVLIEAVRLDYERAHGRIENPVELLQLVANDEQFAWLRPLTRLLVELDEEPEEDPTIERNVIIAAAVGGGLTVATDSEDADSVDVSELLAAASGEGRLAQVRGEVERLFEDPAWTVPYLQVLQDVPEAVLAHAYFQREVSRLPVAQPAAAQEVLS